MFILTFLPCELQILKDLRAQRRAQHRLTMHPIQNVLDFGRSDGQTSAAAKSGTDHQRDDNPPENSCTAHPFLWRLLGVLLLFVARFWCWLRPMRFSNIHHAFVVLIFYGSRLVHFIFIARQDLSSC
jgi:hypothetical protein